jgi:hypothetical protein
MINEPVQKLMKQLGATGCYFLSLIRSAELATSKSLDAVLVYLECAKRGWIDAECYLINPSAIYEYLVGGTWTVRKETKGYTPVFGDVVILRYERKGTMQTDGHFVLGDYEKKIQYDPMGASQTVLNGELASLRILSRSA